ncbi:MAG: metallophosphoesterase [Proteobacteria bacterium]|nr:metallophosphoesterase [Pseudomonadota bacterium]
MLTLLGLNLACNARQPLIMMRRLAFLFLALAALVAAAPAQARAQSVFRNVQRIVVFGDLHGEADKFEDMLRVAGLVDANGNWAGGQTHFVQIGDVEDRGPDSRTILNHLMRLEPQARRAGGYVHALIGNHEAMNMLGDLRYTSSGEFASYASRGAARLRDNYYLQTIAYERAHPPASGLPVFDDAYRADWNTRHPLGYVEQRIAWAPNGVYGRWVASHDAMIVINDIVFMHGGIGPTFTESNIDTINNAVRGALRGQPAAGFADILDNPDGPLWYRGFALNSEASEAANVSAVLSRFHVAHIVVGHTKRTPTIAPRFGGGVILTDVAVPSGASDPHAFLEINNGQMTTIHRGQRIALDGSSDAARCAYLNQVAAADGAGGAVASLASRCDSLGAAATAAP